MRLCFSRRVRKILVYAAHNFAFEITLSQVITLTLLLVCAFSPKVQKYLLGSPFLTIFQVLPKKQNIANYRRFNKIKAALCSAALCVIFYVLLICYTFAD